MRRNDLKAEFNYLYEIKNLVNGKIYWGAHSTNDLDDGYMGSGRLVKAAIAKYGRAKFEKEFVLFVGSAEDLYEWEEALVGRVFISRPDTYNLSVGGRGSAFGVKRRSDSVERLAAGIRAAWAAGKYSRTRPPEIRAKISAGLTGRPVSQESRALISIATRARTQTPEYRAAASAWMSARIVSQETCDAISRAKLGRIPTAETRAKMSAAHKARLMLKKKL